MMKISNLLFIMSFSICVNSIKSSSVKSVIGSNLLGKMYQLPCLNHVVCPLYRHSRFDVEGGTKGSKRGEGSKYVYEAPNLGASSSPSLPK